MAVFAMAAVAFDPAGDTVAAIGADGPTQANLALPLGPLRLLDPATGDTRTLIEGAVVSFWWSPDGRTIARPARPAVEGGAAGENEARLLFVDVASGEITSQAVVVPGQLYVDQLLTYFDQYALSHHVWAPGRLVVPHAHPRPGWLDARRRVLRGRPRSRRPRWRDRLLEPVTSGSGDFLTYVGVDAGRTCAMVAGSVTRTKEIPDPCPSTPRPPCPPLTWRP